MNILRLWSHSYSRYNRTKKLFFLKTFILEQNISTCLIIGAKPDPSSLDFDNLVERGLLELIPSVTVSGVARESSIWPQWMQADGLNLVFTEHEFELVFSNAVIEHVGGEAEQKKFLNEHNRVGKNWVLTTPNRFFPIESHFNIIFAHMRKSWSRGDVTRLLSKGDINKILPPGAKIKGHFFSPTLICYKIYEPSEINTNVPKGMT